MKKDYYTKRIESITKTGPNCWRVVFKHYGQLRRYTTFNSFAVNAFLHPETGTSRRYPTIHDAAKDLYTLGVTICGYVYNPRKAGEGKKETQSKQKQV